jgi:molecular chaperone HtpG
LNEFDSKSLQSIAKGDLDLGDIETADDKKQHEETEKQAKDIVERIKKVLADKVEDVRVSHRLTNSPACIVLNEQDMALYMQHLLKQAGHSLPSSKPVLEINPSHPIVARMKEQVKDERFTDWSTLLFEQAILAEGGQLEDPAGFVSKLNGLMLEMIE